MLATQRNKKNRPEARATTASTAVQNTAAKPAAGPIPSREHSPLQVRHALDLTTAIGEILQTYREAGDQPYGSPFFFVIGAGVSYPSVPLANEIVEHCREIANSYRRSGNPPSSSTLDTYSHWFSLAYPNPRQRQKYLRELIERQPISLANLRLAHLLGAHKLTNLVVTTNFDDYLSKALRLFGHTPAVCDHTRTVARIDAEHGDLQIVHVHGSYLFYDIANLRDEVVDRALLDDNTSLTIRGLLDSVLWTRSPLVVGYSGWEGDVIMEALKGRLMGGHPLAQAIYWFCYSRECAESAPEWLRMSEHVRFVVPPEPESSESMRPGSEIAQVTPGDQAIKEPKLEAREVFDNMIQAFKLPPPALFDNPLNFFASQLESSLPQASVKEDLYSFRILIQRLRQAATEPRSSLGEGQHSEQLDRLRSAMQSSNYREAILACAVLVPKLPGELNAADRDFVLKSASVAGKALLERDVPPDLRHPLALALVRDLGRDELTGPVPSSMIVLYPSRVNQMAYETQTPTGQQGAFTACFGAALREPKADTNGDARISLSEAAIYAGEQMLAENRQQIPVVVNVSADFALFSARSASKGKARSGTLRALLVGVGSYKEKSLTLQGVANDIHLFSNLLMSTKGRLTRTAKVEVLRNREATVANIRTSLRRMVAGSGEKDVLLFYFSGHGAHGSADSPLISSLLTWEFTSTMERGFLPVRDIIKELGEGKAAHRAVIID